MPRRLSQVLALKKGTKTRVYAELMELHKASQRADAFSGFSKTFTPKEEGGETFPPERKKVQLTANEVLTRTKTLLSEYMDLEATVDLTNTGAFADVVVDGVTLLSHVPSTLLLYLEKTLSDLHTMVAKLPTLPEDEEWTLDSNDGLFKTKATQGVRTKKVQKALVLYPATDKHPAQTQLISDDEVVGLWDTIKISGALSAAGKAALCGKIVKLRDAVKVAREEANGIEAQPMLVADVIFGYLNK